MAKNLFKFFLYALFAVCFLSYSCSSDNGNGTINEVGSETDGSDGGEEQPTIRILAIGNSFSEDAVEQNLYELFREAGFEAVIGNLYIGGCSLETHYNNAVSSAADYSYRKVVKGNKSTTENVTMFSGIVNENWDYISLQQSSPLSGMYDTYEPYLSYLVDYIYKYAKNPDVEVVFHQTWAYAANSTHSGFANYGNDQMTMYQAIMDASRQAVKDNGIEIIIPSGTAIQNGRNSTIGDNFCRDGYHLEKTYGRFTAACAWFEALSGINVTSTTYNPSNVSSTYKSICTNAAHYAVQDPYSVNPMTDWK